MTSKKSEDFIYTAEKVWNYSKQISIHFNTNRQFLWAKGSTSYCAHCNTDGSSIYSSTVHCYDILLLFVKSTNSAICYHLKTKAHKWGNLRITEHVGTFMKLFLQWKTSKYYIFSVCVCRLSYPACNAHAPYCHLWSAPSHNIFFKIIS